MKFKYPSIIMPCLHKTAGGPGTCVANKKLQISHGSQDAKGGTVKASAIDAEVLFYPEDLNGIRTRCFRRCHYCLGIQEKIEYYGYWE